MSIRAFTAACSTESVAPRDGAGCVELLNTLFAGERGTERSEGVKSGTIAHAKATRRRQEAPRRAGACSGDRSKCSARGGSVRGN